jgi:hypothetical protein
MASAVRLRVDYSAEAFGRSPVGRNQSGRLLSLAAVRDGMDRGSAAKIGGIDRQTLRDWVHRFKGSGLEGLVDNWTEVPSLVFRRSNWLSSRRSSRSGRFVKRTGSCAGDGSTSNASSPRGSASAFMRAMSESFLKKLGFSHISARAPSSSSGRADRRGFQKNLPRALKAHVDGPPQTTPVEIWFEDEPASPRRMAGFGTGPSAGPRPRQPADQRYDNDYLFGAISPARGVGAALCCPTPTLT